jgi:hypothetical protein
MGTDIHSIAQVRESDGRWITVQAKDIAGGDRSYNTFACLANVRNGRGFAGVLTGEGWPVIAEPRGLPEGLQGFGYEVPVPPYYCEWEKKELNTRWIGDHSHSYLTLAEIKYFYINKMPSKYTTIGYISKKQYLDLVENDILPESWCGGMSGPNYIFGRDIGGDKHLPEGYTHVQTEFSFPAVECTQLKEYIEELSVYGKEYGVSDENVRIVFGFDS